jgi:hypothetical protein
METLVGQEIPVKFLEVDEVRWWRFPLLLKGWGRRH